MKEAAIWQLPSMFFFSAVPRVGRRQLLGEKGRAGRCTPERAQSRDFIFLWCI